MKIKNELVSLKIGNKQYDFKNLILDEYLKRFILRQLDTTTLRYIPYQIMLNTILFKFDTPFENLSPQSEIFPENFDIAFIGGCKSVITIASPSIITTKYTYDMENFIYDYNKKKGGNLPFEDYYGKKIVAIGFSSYFASFTNKNKVCAILDTSNYNIYMQANQKLECTRKDTISTDALFWSSDDRIKAPVHLSPYGGEPLLYQNPYPGFREEDKKFFKARSAIPTKGVLYSIGLSSYTDYIDKEFVIGKDVIVVQNGTELSIQSINNDFNFEKELHPNNLIYPSANLYPIKSNYKYVIFKYKVYQEIEKGVYDEDNNLNFEYIQTDTKSYYYQAIPIDKFGETNFKIKYERG
jgi:hypothetical protein